MTHFRFVTTMTSLDIRKFCRDTCYWTQSIAYRLQSGLRQENSYRDRDWFLQSKKWFVTPFEGGRDTVSIAIYFSLKNSCRNRKNSVTTTYFSEFRLDRTLMS